MRSPLVKTLLAVMLTSYLSLNSLLSQAEDSAKKSYKAVSYYEGGRKIREEFYEVKTGQLYAIKDFSDSYTDKAIERIESLNAANASPVSNTSYYRVVTYSDNQGNKVKEEYYSPDTGELRFTRNLTSPLAFNRDFKFAESFIGGNNPPLITTNTIQPESQKEAKVQTSLANGSQLTIGTAENKDKADKIPTQEGAASSQTEKKNVQAETKPSSNVESKQDVEQAKLAAEHKDMEQAKLALELKAKEQEEQAKLNAEQKAKEQQAKLNAERKAKEQQAKLNAERKAKEQQAKLEKDRQKAKTAQSAEVQAAKQVKKDFTARTISPVLVKPQTSQMNMTSQAANSRLAASSMNSRNAKPIFVQKQAHNEDGNFEIRYYGGVKP